MRGGDVSAEGWKKKEKKNRREEAQCSLPFVEKCFSFSFEAVWKFRLVTVKLNK